LKTLDRYIFTSYLKTFFSVFAVIMMIFLLQSVWLYINELAGKDLDLVIIGKFLLFISQRLVVLVLPLSILLSSIMVFGNFSENYEFAAMKSAGISLFRGMRSVGIFTAVMAVITFFFSNNVIPSAEYKLYNLRRNIAQVKPAMAIVEGQFSDLGDLNIKVGNKYGDNGQFLEEVTIHMATFNRPGNYKVIKAKKGELLSQEGEDILQLKLYDGNYYNELQPKEIEERKKKQHVKSAFESYTINVDLSEINNVNFDDEGFATRYNMLTIGELGITIDSLSGKTSESYNQLSESVYDRTSVRNLNLNITPIKTDTVYNNSIYELYSIDQKRRMADLALGNIRSSKQLLIEGQRKIMLETQNLNLHVIAWHEKFALALSCLILFFVGAPIGALIRKGGFGLPIVIAMVLFLTYHFLNIFAKNSAEDGSLNPVLATWLSTLLMLPLGLYLTNRATLDRPVFESDQLIKPLINLLFKGSKQTIGEENYSHIRQEHLLYSKLTLLLYFALALFALCSYGAQGFEWPIAQTVFKIGIVLFGFIYAVALFKTLALQSGFYKTIGIPNRYHTSVMLIGALPLYGLFYFYFNNQIEEDLKTL
jgi:lipopolysaccharide export system permease protein